MTLTDGAWLTEATVLTHLGVEADEAPSVELSRLAAAAQVEQARPDLYDAELEVYVPTPDVLLAGVLLTARLHARKGSPTGLASYGEFGPAAVLRFDPDVERLLGVGRYAKPRIG